MKQLTVSIPESLYAKLIAVLKETGDTREEVLSEAIEEYVAMYPELWPAESSEESDNSLEME